MTASGRVTRLPMAAFIDPTAHVTGAATIGVPGCQALRA